MTGYRGEGTHTKQESDVGCLERPQAAALPVISPASTSDIEGLVALDVTGSSVPACRVKNRFFEQKMRAYLASPNAFILTAKHNCQIAGYIAVVINPGFALETRRLSRLARQLFLAIRGGYGWSIRYWFRLGRKIYARLWKDPSHGTRHRTATSNEPTAWVNSMMVDKRWRRRGVAGQLLQAAHAKLIEMNVEIVGADVHADNTASLRVFAKAGYRPSNLIRLQNGASTQVLIKWLHK